MKRKRIENQPRGRPRSSESHASILGSTIALIRRDGYDAVTMEAIAAHAGVGKATLYRWWPSKELLVIEAIGRIVVAIPAPDSGTTRGNLLELVEQNARLYRDPATAGLLSGLVAAMARNPEIAEVVRKSLLAPRRAVIASVLKQGIATGDLRAKLDLQAASEVLSGALFYRALLFGGKLDSAYTRNLVDMAYRAFAR